MKAGRHITDLMSEVERQHEAKRDFLVASDQLCVAVPTPVTSLVPMRPSPDGAALLSSMVSDARERRNAKRNVKTFENGGDGLAPVLQFDVGTIAEQFPLTPHAHTQMATRLDVPHGFYKRLLLGENRGLYLDTVNHFLKQSTAKRMVRTLDGVCRADLSDSFRDLDNYDLLRAILPVLTSAGCKVLSCDVTDTKLYIKALSPELEGEVGLAEQHKIHKCQGGIVIVNSEIGSGQLRLEGLLHVTACSNGMWTGTSFKKTHLGRRLGHDLDETREFFTDVTKQADDRAFFLKCKDVVNGILSHDAFQGTLDRMNGAANSLSVADPVGAVEIVKKRFDWSDGEAISIRTKLIQQVGDFGLAKWGLAQAITQVAQDGEMTYDRASELEEQAGQVIELPKSDWQEISENLAA